MYVRNSILSNGSITKTSINQTVYLIISIRACFQFTVFIFPLVIEIMLERNLFVLASQIFIDSHRQIRLPRHIADTEIQSFTVIISSHPCRKCTIICTATPFSCFIIQPECTFRSMTGSQHRHFTCRSDRINFSYSLCGYFNSSVKVDTFIFKRLWREGRIYRNAEYDFINVDKSSAVAAIYSGTTPYTNGIVGDNWMDRSTLRVLIVWTMLILWVFTLQSPLLRRK